MSEKMKCARCGKRFKQTNKKQVFCAECHGSRSRGQKVRAAVGQVIHRIWRQWIVGPSHSRRADIWYHYCRDDPAPRG